MSKKSTDWTQHSSGLHSAYDSARSVLNKLRARGYARPPRAGKKGQAKIRLYQDGYRVLVRDGKPESVVTP